MIKRAISLALAAGSIAVGTVGVLGAAPAQAETVVYHGRVVSTSGLTERSFPSTTGSKSGSLANRQTFDIVCKVHGRSIDGNNVWYAISPTRWVSARYVANAGPAPSYCGTVVHITGRASTTVNQRIAPSTADGKTGTIAKGASVRIVCQTTGQSVLGNTKWYYLENGRWVSSRYVNGFEGWPNDCA